MNKGTRHKIVLPELGTAEYDVMLNKIAMFQHERITALLKKKRELLEENIRLRAYNLLLEKFNNLYKGK